MTSQRRLSSSYGLTLVLLPIFLLSFGCEEDSFVRLRANGEFQPGNIDFGEVPVGMSRTVTVDLMNIGTPPLNVDTIDVPQSFTIEAAKGAVLDSLIPAGNGMEIDVTFLALEEGARSGTVMVHSDGVDIPLQVAGVGVIRRLPMLTLEPNSLDFGVVETGSDARQTVTVRNSGNAAGVLTAFSLANTMDYSITTALPLTVNGGDTAVLEVMFRPSVPGARHDVMTITAQDHAALTLTITGEGRVPQGELLCQPSAISFGQVERGDVAMQQVACTARGGPARLLGAAVPTSQSVFSLPMPPMMMDIDDGSSVIIPVEFSAQGVPMVHRAMLTVTFGGGMGVANVQVPLTGEVVPPPPTATAISLVMSWDSNLTDVDLHLVRPGGRTFDSSGGSDCYYGASNPDWNTTRDNTDDPFLDVDDIDGLGPENINLQTTAPGRYEVYIHYFADRNTGPTNATLEVHIAGNLAATVNRNISCNQMWHAGTIDWDGMAGTWQASNSVTMINEGFCGF